MKPFLRNRALQSTHNAESNRVDARRYTLRATPRSFPQIKSSRRIQVLPSTQTPELYQKLRQLCLHPPTPIMPQNSATIGYTTMQTQHSSSNTMSTSRYTPTHTQNPTYTKSTHTAHIKPHKCQINTTLTFNGHIRAAPRSTSPDTFLQRVPPTIPPNTQTHNSQHTKTANPNTPQPTTPQSPSNTSTSLHTHRIRQSSLLTSSHTSLYIPLLPNQYKPFSTNTLSIHTDPPPDLITPSQSFSRKRQQTAATKPAKNPHTCTTFYPRFQTLREQQHLDNTPPVNNPRTCTILYTRHAPLSKECQKPSKKHNQH